MRLPDGTRQSVSWAHLLEDAFGVELRPLFSPVQAGPADFVLVLDAHCSASASSETSVTYEARLLDATGEVVRTTHGSARGPDVSGAIEQVYETLIRDLFSVSNHFSNPTNGASERSSLGLRIDPVVARSAFLGWPEVLRRGFAATLSPAFNGRVEGAAGARPESGQDHRA